MTDHTNRPIQDLIDESDPAWPIVEQWARDAQISIEVLPTDRAAGEAALSAVQVTTRSPMGAICYHAAGMFLDHGWLRILGAGGHDRFERSLPGWNEGRSNGFYLVADDAIGGSFAMNGGGLGEDRGNLYYYAPDTLAWEPCEFGYSTFLEWAVSDGLQKFYEPLRWDGWQSEVAQLTGDQSINFFPFLFAEGRPLAERSRRPLPVAEQYGLQLDMQQQLDEHQE